MEYITIDRIMDRLFQNPMLKSLQKSTVASYVKDLASLNRVTPLLGTGYWYIRTQQYKGEIPADCSDVKDVYVCNIISLDNSLFSDEKLNSALSSSIVREKDKTGYGEYKVENNVLFVDLEDSLLVEIKGTRILVDDSGYPLIPYDGSLMEAVINWVKYHHFTILFEMDKISKAKVDAAHQQYCWYIGQYVSNVEMISVDEAVSVANSWQRLINTRNLNKRGRSLPEHLNM